MQKGICIFLLTAMVACGWCQLFNDILPPRPGSRKGGFEKTINFDNIKLSDRPGAKNGYLPPQPPTYLPPDKVPSSTNGPTYLPPTKRTIPTRPSYSYMPTMGTFPPTRHYNYSTYKTSTYKYMPAPVTLPPLVTTLRTTTGYVYNAPNIPFAVEDRRKGG